MNALVRRVSEGEEGVAEQLLPLVYDELRAMAGNLFRKQPMDHTLEPTALVHEAYMKMVGGGDGGEQKAGWNDRTHFVSVAAVAMRQVLVNHARDKRAAKRGGGEERRRVTISATPSDFELDYDVLAVHEALEVLAGVDPRQSQIAELRFFGGLSLDEVAEVIGVSRRTVALEWKMAKGFLADKLTVE